MHLTRPASERDDSEMHLSWPVSERDDVPCIPPGLYLSGKMCPGRRKSAASVAGSASALTVAALSSAEMPVVVPCFRSWRREQGGEQGGCVRAGGVTGNREGTFLWVKVMHFNN